MKAIILAAGYATRMYPLTKDKPKALLPIGGKVMLDYLMDEIATIREIDTVYIVTNSRFAGQFSAWAEEAAARYPRLKLDVLVQPPPEHLASGQLHSAGPPVL